jgi:flagellar hook assembly protein FlgD
VDATSPGVQVRSIGPSPLRLTGSQQLRAAYRIDEGATLGARVERLDPTATVQTFATRTKASAGLVEYVWNGKNRAGNDVQPGRYRMVLEVTDQAGNTTVQRSTFRVTR